MNNTDLIELTHLIIIICTYFGIECTKEKVIEEIIEFSISFHYNTILQTIINLGIIFENTITRICDSNFVNKSIEKTNQQIIELLLKNGVNIDTVSSTQYTPLQSLCNRSTLNRTFNKFYNKRITILLKYNANTDITDQYFRTPFQNLIIYNNILALEIFFKYQKTFDHNDSFYLGLFQDNNRPELLKILSIHLVKKYYNSLDDLLSNPVYTNSDYITELVKMKRIEFHNFRTIRNLCDFIFAKNCKLQKIYAEYSIIFSTIEAIVSKKCVIYETLIIEKIQKIRSKLNIIEQCNEKDELDEQQQSNELPPPSVQQNNDRINGLVILTKHIQSLRKTIEFNKDKNCYMNIRDEVWRMIEEDLEEQELFNVNWKTIYEGLADNIYNGVEFEQNDAELNIRQNAELVEQKDNLHDELDINNNKELTVNEGESRCYLDVKEDEWEAVFDEYERRKIAESAEQKDALGAYPIYSDISDEVDIFDNIQRQNLSNVQVEEDWHAELELNEHEIDLINIDISSLIALDDNEDILQYFQDKDVLEVLKQEMADENHNVIEPKIDLNGFVDDSKGLIFIIF